MSKEFNKRVEGNEVIFENSEARWIFSQGRPPYIDDYRVAIQVVDKNIGIPTMIVMDGREFRRMLLDMGIKTLNEPTGRLTFKGVPIEFDSEDNLTGLKPSEEYFERNENSERSEDLTSSEQYAKIQSD